MGEEQHTAIQELKSLITQAEILDYLRVDCRTGIVAVASQVGLGAVPTQEQGRMWRAVSYACRSLTDVKRRYSQKEKEALALVWVCERFNMYLSRRSFEGGMGHKTLEPIYLSTYKPYARIEK